MKATGIVRKIDELGRVVIPKEIRRTLRINEGDPLEIFTSRDGEVIFKKYSPLNELETIAKSCVTALNEAVGHITLVCDKDTILACEGAVRDGYTNKRISDKLEKAIEQGEVIMVNTVDNIEIIPIKIDDGEDEYVSQIICPIRSGSSVIGAVAMLSQKPGVEFAEKELKMCDMAALILSKFIG